MQTEFDFTLPLGYVDPSGAVHKHGVMRLATAMDEIDPLRDPRVRANQAYLVIMLLSRVIIKLGTLADAQITPFIIESLFAPDLAYLQAFYRHIHEQGHSKLSVVCQACNAKVEIDLASLGES